MACFCPASAIPQPWRRDLSQPSGANCGRRWSWPPAKEEKKRKEKTEIKQKDEEEKILDQAENKIRVSEAASKSRPRSGDGAASAGQADGVAGRWFAPQHRFPQGWIQSLFAVGRG